MKMKPQRRVVILKTRQLWMPGRESLEFKSTFNWLKKLWQNEKEFFETFISVKTFSAILFII